MNDQKSNTLNHSNKNLVDVSPEQLRSIEGGQTAPKIQAFYKGPKTNSQLPQTSSWNGLKLSSGG